MTHLCIYLIYSYDFHKVVGGQIQTLLLYVFLCNMKTIDVTDMLLSFQEISYVSSFATYRFDDATLNCIKSRFLPFKEKRKWGLHLPESQL